MTEYANEYERLKAQKDRIIAEQTERFLKPYKDLIDHLALALTDRHHQWSPELRAEYESLMGRR